MFNPLACLSVVQQAAIGAYRWRGCGDKEAGDAAAVEAMHKAFLQMPFLARVVVGEGEKDEAPMLYAGELLGNGAELQYDIAVDPLEGTRLLAHNQPDSITTLALAPANTIYAPKESFYMEKIVIPKPAVGVVDPLAPVEENVTAVAKALGKNFQDFTVFVLAKPRHEELIQRLRSLGVRVLLRTDGDVAGSLLVLQERGLFSQSVDMMLGIGGTPEGVLTACAVKATGGELFARFAPQSDSEKELLQKHAISTTDWYSSGYFVRSSEVFFFITGVTSGLLLDGVESLSDTFLTHSLIFDGKSQRSMRITEYCSAM